MSGHRLVGPVATECATLLLLPFLQPGLIAWQDRINAWRALSNSYVQIPTIKAMVGLKTGNPAWNRVLPPMLPLAAAQLADLKSKFVALP